MSRARSPAGGFSRLEPLRSCSSRKKRSACFPEESSLSSGTALPTGRKPLLLAVLFRAGDGEGDEPGNVVIGLLFPAGAAQEPLFPPEESRFFSPPFFAPVTARATSRARSLLSDCFSRLEPLRSRSSHRRKAASSRFPSSRPRRRGRRAGRGRCCRTAFPGWSRSGTALPARSEAPVFRKQTACFQELLFPPEENRFFSPSFFAPVTARATSREMSLSGCFSRLEPLRNRSSRRRKAASSRCPFSRR